MERVVDDPNSQSSQLLDNLKHISNQGEAYSKYDNEVVGLKDDELVESFFTANHYMLNNFLVIIIILVLALFILYNFK
jgi:hypothetical protein